MSSSITGPKPKKIKGQLCRQSAGQPTRTDIVSVMMRTIVIALVIAVAGAVSSAIVFAGIQWHDNRYVTIASTERSDLRRYRLQFLDLKYLEDENLITPRQQLQKDQLFIDIEELKEQLGK